ncbi:MAG: hypothetical protein ACRD0H_18510 [Actinomycetes bacterium]
MIGQPDTHHAAWPPSPRTGRRRMPCGALLAYLPSLLNSAATGHNIILFAALAVPPLLLLITTAVCFGAGALDVQAALSCEEVEGVRPCPHCHP